MHHNLRRLGEGAAQEGVLGPTSRPPVLLGKGTGGGPLQAPAEGEVRSTTEGPPSKPSREIEMAGDPERMGTARGRGRGPPPSRKSLQQPAVGCTFWLLGDPAPSKPRETHTTFSGTPPGLGLGALPGQCEAPRTVGPQIRRCFQKDEEMLTAECRKVRDACLPRFTNKYVQRMNFYGVAPQIEKSNVARVPEVSSSFTSALSASSNCWDHVTTDFWDHYLLFSEDGTLSNILSGACGPVGSWALGFRLAGTLHRAPGPRCISVPPAPGARCFSGLLCQQRRCERRHSQVLRLQASPPPVRGSPSGCSGFRPHVPVAGRSCHPWAGPHFMTSAVRCPRAGTFLLLSARSDERRT